MRRLPLSLAAIAAATVLSSGCGTTLYTLEPLEQPEARLTEDADAITRTKGDISVTVGPLGPIHGQGFNVGVVVNNNSDEALRLRVGDARVLVNGKPASLIDRTHVENVKRMDRMAGALNAASTSLAQSNARIAAREDLGRELTDQQAREAMNMGQQTMNAALQAMEARNRLGQDYAAELAKMNSASWNQTYEVRWMMPQNIQLIDQHLWRDETVPPRSWVLRCVITEAESVAALGGQRGMLSVEIDVGGERFAYRFDAVARSLGEANDELKKRRQRILAVRGH